MNAHDRKIVEAVTAKLTADHFFIGRRVRIASHRAFEGCEGTIVEKYPRRRFQRGVDLGAAAGGQVLVFDVNDLYLL